MLIALFVVALCFVQIVTDEMEPRVVGGARTKIHKHPFSAFILVFEIIGGHMCGGSIINQRIILTAAHCFEYVSPDTILTATVGSANFQRGRKIRIIAIKQHPNYDPDRIVNDIALAGLKEPVVFGRTIKKIIMATKRPLSGKAMLAGWGLIQEVPYGVYTTYLHELSQNIISPQKCRRYIKATQNGTFCGGKPNAKSYISTGDSGSPLVMKRYLQIGLVSYKNAYISRSIVIFTDISYYYKWITDNAKSVYCISKFVKSKMCNGSSY